MTECICANKELVASCVHPYCPEHGYDEDKERSCRIGEAVLELGEYVPFLIECAIETIENGAGFDDDALPRIRAFRASINAALRGGS